MVFFLFFFFPFLFHELRITFFTNRSIGGIRVSLYNAITEEQTDRIVAYMHQFVEGTPVQQPPLPSESQ